MKVEEIDEWRKNLRPGDMVYFGNTHGGRLTLALPVMRFTKTQAVCGTHANDRRERFMLASGKVVGSVWFMARPFTAEMRAKIAAGTMPALWTSNEKRI